MTSDGTLNYQYDAWNRLVRVTSNGNWNVNGYIYYADYAYDGLNRRIEKVVYRGSMMLPVEHYYYNQNWQMLEDRTVVDPFGTCGSTEYIWSPRYVDSPIVSFYQDLYHPQFDNVRYYATDANHNVTATIDGTTGDVVNRYSYAAYGKATEYDASWSNAAAPTSDGPLYCGYFFDAETANYYCRNRYLSTALGTFINRDPIGYEGGINLYEYCNSNPMIYADALGLSPCDDLKDMINDELEQIEFTKNKLNDLNDQLIGEMKYANKALNKLMNQVETWANSYLAYVVGTGAASASLGLYTQIVNSLQVGTYGQASAIIAQAQALLALAVLPLRTHFETELATETARLAEVMMNKVTEMVNVKDQVKDAQKRLDDKAAELKKRLADIDGMSDGDCCNMKKDLQNDIDDFEMWRTNLNTDIWENSKTLDDIEKTIDPLML
jgi:RHS repeat-associated protein